MQLNEFLQMTGLTMVVKGENGKYTVDFAEDVVISEFPVGHNRVLTAHADLKTAINMLITKFSGKTLIVNNSVKHQIPSVKLS